MSLRLISLLLSSNTVNEAGTLPTFSGASKTGVTVPSISALALENAVAPPLDETSTTARRLSTVTVPPCESSTETAVSAGIAP